MTFDVSVIVGPGLGAILVAGFEAGGAVAVDAATFAASALLLRDCGRDAMHPPRSGPCVWSPT